MVAFESMRRAPIRVTTTPKEQRMAIYDVTILDGAPGGGVSNAANIGGGLIAAIYIPTGSENVTFTLLYSADGTTFDPICDESDSPITITYLAGGALHQINPPVRAPIVKLKGETGNETGDLVCEIHTV